MIWIDGGLHATEVLGAQQLIETIYQFVSKTDEETMRILRDVIILAAHANPDGMELVSDWYMRKPNREAAQHRQPAAALPEVRRPRQQPRLLHDEPAGVARTSTAILYREWFPQIMYNHHQTGPTGTVMFSPPFRDPFNYVYDPLVVNTLDQVGAAMHTRFDAEGKPGVTTRSGSNYSTWWNGGLRTMAYFHNQVGLLTESIGNPTPETIGFVPDRLIAQRRPAVPDRAADVALPPVDRLLDHRQLRGARLRAALPREPALQHLPDGQEQHRRAATPTPGRSIRAASPR